MQLLFIFSIIFLSNQWAFMLCILHFAKILCMVVLQELLFSYVRGWCFGDM